MSFNSLAFLVLVAGTLLFFYNRWLRKWQVDILILASILFYAYGQPHLLLLLLLSVTVTAFCTFRLLNSAIREQRIRWAAIGVAVNLAVLAFFKYNTLLADAIWNELTTPEGLPQWLLMLPLPIGISFFTFHGISLLIDTLREDAGLSRGEVETTFSRFYKTSLFYIIFFPQLVAGPIVKAREFIPQITTKYWRNIDWYFAIRCVISGYFLKMVVADNLKDQTFWIEYPYFLDLSSVDLVVLLFAYSMQIFADFAGYSLIALGVAALFGYRLPINFNYPYVSQSFSEFWRRWHISLSTWLREYLYIPLGGNRHGEARTYFNLFIVMFLGGLWHGAAWSYAIWGCAHGVALALERPFRQSWFLQSEAWWVVIARITIVFVFVSCAWLLFKLPEFDQVIAYIQAIASNFHRPVSSLAIALIAIFSFPVIVYHAVHLVKRGGYSSLSRVEPFVFGAMFASIVLNSGNSDAFIYFQF